MILVDTDHLSVLSDQGHSKHASLMVRIESSSDPVLALPVVSIQEQLRGWLALLHRRRDVRQQIPVYDRSIAFLDFTRRWPIAPLDDRAAAEFDRLRRARVRIGTQDLKIASIALARDALLLSANLRDFGRVPGLRVQSWLD